MEREPMVLVLIDPVWQEFVNKQIEDMNRYKMRMFASLSHELRTPLNCSISMLEFLETDLIHLANKSTFIGGGGATTAVAAAAATANLFQNNHQYNTQMLSLRPQDSSSIMQTKGLPVEINRLPRSATDSSAFPSRRISNNNNNNNNNTNYNSSHNMITINNKDKEDSEDVMFRRRKTTNLLNSPRDRNLSSVILSSKMNALPDKMESNMSANGIQDECERIIDSYLKPALHSSKLLLNLINDILDFVQIDSGKFKFTFVSFSLEKLLHECVVLINLQAKSRNIKLEIDFDSNISGNIESDPNRIRQVLLNFLSNALKFTVKGSITVQAKLVPDSQENNLILLSVTDTGIGISEKDIQNIFTIFNKVDLGQNQGLNSQGCGLGLTISNSISKGLAPDKVGGVQVESVVGVGSKFSFLIQNHSPTAFKSQVKQSCDVIPSEEDEQNRPKAIIQNKPKKFRSPVFELNFEGGKYFCSEDEWPLGGGEEEKGDRIGYNMIQELSPSGVLGREGDGFTGTCEVVGVAADIAVAVKSKKKKKKKLEKSDKCDGFFNGNKDCNQKETRMIESILNEGGRCPCVQILAADDNEFNLIVISQIFKKSNLKAEYACNGEIAFQKILERRQNNQCCPDYKIIFMDIEMPIMNGYQTSQAIYEYYQSEEILFKRPYVVACTAMVGEDEKDLARQHSMDNYITKPIQTSILEQVLMEFVSYYLKIKLMCQEEACSS